MKAKRATTIRWFCRAGLLALAGTLAGCVSVKQMAVNKLGDALAGGGTTFASDDDPELIAAAVPFSLKLMESLLAESPRHAGLLLASTRGFTQYAFAFVSERADEIEATDYAGAEHARARAKRLYLRARDYGLRGLAVAHRDFRAALAADPRGAVRVATTRDVALLYWTAAAWGSAVSLGKDDAALVGELPQVEALIDRALELDEAFEQGAIHSFLITYELSRQGVAGDPFARAQAHYLRAVQLADGRLAGPFVTYAESVCIERQDVDAFDAALRRALAIDADAHPEYRLANLVMQQRARWLQGRRDELFLLAETNS